MPASRQEACLAYRIIKSYLWADRDVEKACLIPPAYLSSEHGDGTLFIRSIVFSKYIKGTIFDAGVKFIHSAF